MAERSRNKASVFKGLSLQQFRKKFGMRTQGPVTAIDLDGQVLRVVQTVPRGSRTAVTRILAERLDLPADADRSDPELMGKAMAKTLDRLRVKPGTVVMGVPRAQVVLRTLTLPVIEDLRELASMVHFQIGKDLPFRLDDAVIDFKVRRQPSPPSPPPPEPEQKAEGQAGAGEEKPEPPPAPAPKLEVLVAAVKRDVVEFYQETAAAAGLKLSALGWLSYANARCLEACRVAKDEESIALISLRPDEVSIDVIAQQFLLFSRGAAIKLRSESAPPPPAAPEPPVADKPAEAPPAEPPAASGPETFVDAVTIEVVRSLHSYGGMEPHPSATKIVVAGATGNELAVVEALQNRLNIPGSVLDPVSALDLPRAAREHAAGTISALGLGLAANDPQGLPFDFLNPKRPAVQRNMRRIRIIMGVAAALAAVLLVAGVQRHFITKRDLQLKALKDEYDKEKKKRPIYTRMRVQATAIQNWTFNGRNWLDHYAYLSAILPASEEIYISTLSVSPQGVIRFAVQARSGGVLAKLDKELRAAGYGVKPLAINPGADRFGYNFRSNVELTVPDKMKFDLTKVRPPSRPADDVSLEGLPKTTRKGGRP